MMEIRINNMKSENNFEHIQMRINEIVNNSISNGIEINTNDINKLMMDALKSMEEYNNSIKEWYDDKFVSDKMRYMERINKVSEDNIKYSNQDYIRIID